MNRRNFFQTIIAAIAAIFMPKSEKAETQSITFGTDSNNDDVTVTYWAEGLNGTCRKLTEDELKHYIFAFSQDSEEIRKAWDKHRELQINYLVGQQRWGIYNPPKGSQDA